MMAARYTQSNEDTMNKHNTFEICKFAAQIRLETLREFEALGFGHVGGAMSIVELLAVLYGGVMRIDPSNPNWADRDWLVCSKGHAGPAVYRGAGAEGVFPHRRSADAEQAGHEPAQPLRYE